METIRIFMICITALTSAGVGSVAGRVSVSL